MSNPVPTGFQLLVQAPEDIAVLSVPSWWTPRRLWMALGGTAVVLALALGWAWLLRRKVTQRSAELAAEMGVRWAEGRCRGIHSYGLSIEKARKLLGYRPRYGVMDSLKEALLNWKTPK